MPSTISRSLAASRGFGNRSAAAPAAYEMSTSKTWPSTVARRRIEPASTIAPVIRRANSALSTGVPDGAIDDAIVGEVDGAAVTAPLGPIPVPPTPGPDGAGDPDPAHADSAAASTRLAAAPAENNRMSAQPFIISAKEVTSAAGGSTIETASPHLE